MSKTAILSAGNKRFLARGKNLNLQNVVLPRTPENVKMVEQYNALAAEINAIPARIAGLHMNYRPRMIPARAYQLLQERDEKMARLLELEKILFPKKA